MQFALNHMVAPKLGYTAFFDLAVGLGVKAVEIRNDITPSLMDIASARNIRAMAMERGLSILTVNALQRFNNWIPARAEEAKTLAAYTAATGAKALILVPVNDTAFAPPTAARLGGLRDALRGLAPILHDHGLIGLVEPLGFAECSLRLKVEAIAAIDDVGEAARFQVTHDTFHHFVAGEQAMFPARTGLIHASGVTDRRQSASTMRDPHRVLVDAADSIDNAGQLKRLQAGGCTGAVSLEPFAASVHDDPAIAEALKASLTYLAQSATG
jgi:2-keto-myo-inositol isomerase